MICIYSKMNFNFRKRRITTLTGKPKFILYVKKCFLNIETDKLTCFICGHL